MVFERVKAIVGIDSFFDDPEILESYSRDHSFAPARLPLAVVKPKNIEQIKDLIDFARETLTTLIPTSSGFPKFHGDTVPTCPGVIVDLSGLDRVVRVDQRNKIAVIEPGVTFEKLRTALDEYGMLPYIPLLPRATKSVLASALEREPITIAKDHWDFNDPIAGGEVVLGDGHIQGFGDSAGFNLEEVASGKATPVIPLGPSCIGWLNLVQGAQGTLGIVRWASVRCRAKPSIQKSFFVAGADLEAIIPFSQKIARYRIVEESFTLNSFALATLFSANAAEITRLQRSLPSWVLFLNVAGYERYPEEEMGWKGEQVASAAREYGLELTGAVGPISATSLAYNLEHSVEKDRRLRFKESCQVLLYSTTLDKTAQQVTILRDIAADYGYPPNELSIYIQPVIQGCQCQGEVVYFYDPNDESEVQMVRALYSATTKELSHRGGYYTRPYGPLGDITFNDAGIASVLKKIKEILDPNDILNTGKIF